LKRPKIAAIGELGYEKSSKKTLVDARFKR